MIEMKNAYTNLKGEEISLSVLTADEKRFLGDIYARYKEGINFLTLENIYNDPASPVYAHARRLKRPVAESPLYMVCDDLAKRLGIRQGYLLRESIVPYATDVSEERKELTTGDVAKIAGVSHEAVRKAIRTGRLRARRVGKLSLIWEKDAEAFALARGGAVVSSKR